MTEATRKTILISGATGYIGRRLTHHLLDRTDVAVRLLVRNRAKVQAMVADHVAIFEGDTFRPQSLDAALAGVDTAFYLIHSMGSEKDYRQMDRLSAENFRDACIRAGVRRMVYLGGLGVRGSASKHLLSRIETGETLAARPELIQTIWFRAGVIIGSGSASFEIIRNLVQKLPIMITPRWVNTKTQAIAIDDVLAYLDGAIDLAERGDLQVDIGADIVSFREMMQTAAEVMGLRRLLIPVPLLSPRLSAYWLLLFSPVPYRIAAALVEGLKCETLVQNDQAARCFPEIRPVPFRDAVQRALLELEDNQVLSRWCDSSGMTACDIKDFDNPAGAILRDVRRVPLNGVAPDAVFRAACALGGHQGWYRYDLLWRLRGLIDKLLGGYGLNRGRRLGRDLRVGDAVDFWKVVDLRSGKRLLLFAQMKVPGRAWLEFDIQPDCLVQTAHFLPKGIWGRLYWYAVLPLHNLVFSDLARKVVETGRALESGRPGSGN